MKGRNYATGFAALTVAAAVTGLWLTSPNPMDSTVLEGITPDAEAGRIAFAAAGCASCHVAPDSEASDSPVLAGGRSFSTAFGTFFAPNISPDPVQGIGSWSTLDVVNAVMRGVSPAGEHYYPAFPYSSYARAEVQDVANIAAYLMTLPASDTPSQPHDLSFPFNIRLSLGGWKLLFQNTDWIVSGELTEQQQRGRYLVEGLGHCGECHTARNALGGLDTGKWLGGAANPSGQGRIPNITPGALTWSAFDIAAYLETGFTPEFDSAGGEMAHVVRNMAQLPASDREAIAAYLKIVPAVE